jgi:hypothetical protein
VALLALFALPTQLPALRDVQPRPHAVERHGEDANTARLALSNCKSGLKIKVCPPSSVHGLSVVFWCQEPGASLCPGCIATISGLEKTTFIRPCGQWERCQ